MEVMLVMLVIMLVILVMLGNTTSACNDGNEVTLVMQV